MTDSMAKDQGPLAADNTETETVVVDSGEVGVETTGFGVAPGNFGGPELIGT